MNIETITMDPHVAAGKLAAASRMLKSQKRNQEWQALQRGYEALAKGTALVDPLRAIRQAGFGDDGRPLLAIARADRKSVSVQATSGVHWAYKTRQWWTSNEVGISFRTSEHYGTGYGLGFDCVIPAPRPNEYLESDPHPVGDAMVPMIPPDVYPARGEGTPADWFILWEADWSEPPRDPILLKPIGGNLYAVLASWDLTDLERAVIAGTRAT